MTGYEFIFSDKPSIRLGRHLSFWIAFGVHFFIQGLLVPGVNEALTPRTSSESLINISYFLPVYIISVYIFIEIVIPRLLFKAKFLFFAVATIGLLLFNFFACYLSGLLYEHIELKMPYSAITFADNKYHAIVNGLFISVIILFITGGIKVAKKWFQKQRENEALAKQKIDSELQLLKIQINPRFLFNSLHTVKDHIINQSSRSPQLILQVSDLLSYILYESDQQYVPLEKELEMITDYIGLEENSVGGTMAMKVVISGDVTDKYITPLILLSIVETEFEYFLEKKLKEFTSLLNIDVRGQQLDLQIEYTTFNNEFFEPFVLNEKFDGIRKQLNNLYPGNHHFYIESIPGNVTIFLKNVPLYIAQPAKEALQTSGNA
ncbi:MAG: histidine kinase [Ginsengibacter sp.]